MIDIDSSYGITDDQIASFRKRGFVKLANVLSDEVLDHYEREFTRVVQHRNKQTLPMAQRSTYQKAFIQIINLWKDSDVVKEFVFGQRLARIAAELLGTRGVRMYHDQALYKEPGGGFTPWHADQYYWPFASEKCCTVWIPLQDTPLEMGPLGFSEGSHKVTAGRDLSISDQSEQLIDVALSDAGLPYIEEPFSRGDVSFHYGWTFHRAGGNESDLPREAMTIIYMDVDMRMKAADNEHQKPEIWCPGVEVGSVIDTPVTPVLFSE